MTKFDDKPTTAQRIDADEFMKLANEAMLRACRVAKKEAKRCGLKLVVERSHVSAKKKRSRRVVERV